MAKKKPKQQPKRISAAQRKRIDEYRAVQRTEAATAVAKAWLAKPQGGFHEWDESDDPEAGSVRFLGSTDGRDRNGVGGEWVNLSMFVSNLDVEMAEAGEHIDVVIAEDSASDV